MGRVQAEGSWGVGPHGTEDRVAPGPCACRRAGSDGMQGGNPSGGPGDARRKHVPLGGIKEYVVGFPTALEN